MEEDPAVVIVVAAFGRSCDLDASVALLKPRELNLGNNGNSRFSIMETRGGELGELEHHSTVGDSASRHRGIRFGLLAGWLWPSPAWGVKAILRRVTG